jgi:competence protein ComEC
LSYAAVLGILTFHRPIYGLLYFKNSTIDKLWSVTVLSFAAQLGTFPLAAHYFHFFPTYFWLSNLLIFPLSFAIIIVGMAFISVSWLPLIPKFVGLVLSGLVYILNQIVGLVKYLPFYGLNDLYFPWPKVLLVYLIIILVFVMLNKKNIRLLVPVLSVFLMLLLFETAHKFNVLKQNRIVVYSLNKSSAYDFIRGEEHLLLLDSIALNSDKNLDYFLLNSRLAWGLETNKAVVTIPNLKNNIGLYYDVDFAAFGDFKIAIVDGMRTFCPVSKKKIKLDAIFVKGKKSLKISDLRACFDANTIILDASVPYWKSKKIEKESESLGVNTHNVKKQGAYILELGQESR